MTVPDPETKSRFALVGRLLLFALLASAIALWGLLLVGVRASVHGSGVVVAVEREDIICPWEGRLTILERRSGDEVQPGEALLLIESDALKEELLAAEHAVAECRAELQYKQASARLLLLNPLPKEFWHLDIEIEERENNCEESRATLERLEKLAAAGGASGEELRVARLRFIEDKASRNRVREKKALLDQGLLKAYVEQSGAEARWVEARLKTLESHVENLKAKSARGRISAPAKGVLAGLPDHPGAYYPKGAVIASIVKGAGKRVLTTISEKDIQEVGEGQEAAFYSHHYRTWVDHGIAGRVARVSPQGVERLGSIQYEVEIDIGGGSDLKLGSAGEVHIYTGRHSLYELVTGH